MTTTLRSLGLTFVCVLWAASASAQTSTAPPATSENTRPATTTFTGDTGLWFVPTAEILPDHKWSVSGYRRGTNYIQGFTNVGDFAGTFGYGIKDKVEVFGSFLFDTRVDRDARPLFQADPKVGGLIDRYPRMASTWTGDQLGDFYIGAKVNFWSQFRQKPAALALRAVVKIPTGKDDEGVSTGKTDASFDVVFSKETTKHLEGSAYGGYEFRGKPDGFDAPSGAFRWGAGVGYPARKSLRGTFEFTGTLPSADSLVITGTPIVGTDGSVAPLTSSIQSTNRATAGLTWQHRNGFFVGGGLSWNLPMKGRDGFNADSDPSSIIDFADWQVRIGYHPGVRVYVPPPPPTPTPTFTPAPPPPPPPAAANRPPTVTAACDPCSVLVGRTATVTANATDPDGDTLTYRWTAPSGTLATPATRQSVWTAPQQTGPVTLTVAVSDGRGGTANATTTITVTAPPPVVELTFEDVYFDFDRSSLRPEALRLLDDAVTKLQANPGRNIVIEGHTCNIGTAEYNLALGERRASSVRDYLVSRGVAANRLEIRSYGEERPKYDNAREETRRLNRRAALVVRVQ